MDSENIFDGIPNALTEELFTTIYRAKTLRIERIVSEGHHSPDGFWYDQDENEWLIVLKGNASIQFEDDPQSVELLQGSYLNIPAHKKHRVLQTSATEKTIWLAVHYGND